MRNQSRVALVFWGKPRDLRATVAKALRKKVKEQAHSLGLQQYPSKAPVVLAFPRLFPPDPSDFYTAVPYRRHLNFSILLCHRLTGIWGLFLALIIISNPDLWHIRHRFSVAQTQKKSESLCQEEPAISLFVRCMISIPSFSKHAHCLKTFALGICNTSQHAFHLFSR